MIVGLDFDGVCTYMPQFLKYLTNATDVTTYIITSKREKSKPEIEYMLNRLNIKYDSVHCIPNGVNSDLEAEIEHKVRKCKELKVDVFIDDKLEVVKSIGSNTDTFVLWRTT